MTILLLQSELGRLRGGGENFTRNLFATMARRGHRMEAAFVADRKGRYPFAAPPGVEPIPLRGWWSRNLGQTTLSSIGRVLPRRDRIGARWGQLQDACAWRVVRWHDRRFKDRVERQLGRRWADFDAVYVHGNAELAAAVAHRRPTVLRLPGPLTEEYEPLLRSIQAVCANGDALVRIRQFLGEDAVELPIGLDVDLFTPGPTEVRSTRGWAAHDFVIGYVGRLTRVKGVDLLAMAFRELQAIVTEARLLIVGSGPEEDSIRSILTEALAKGSAHIEPDLGPDHLPPWYRAMDLFVLPSRYENFSNALLEAIACGRPFLVSDIGGNRVLAGTNAGWSFESNSLPSLVAKLRQLHHQRSTLSRMGHSARAEIGARYNWVKTAEHLESILQRICVTASRHRTVGT